MGAPTLPRLRAFVSVERSQDELNSEFAIIKVRGYVLMNR
jgi:hypothetical protein